MRFAAILILALSAVMLALVPSMAPAPANMQAIMAVQPQPQMAHEMAHASDCHDAPPARHTSPEGQQAQCLTLCLAAHGGLLPHMPDAGAGYTPLPHIMRPALARAMVSVPTALDPPPPRPA